MMKEITKITEEIIPIEQGELGMTVSSIELHRKLQVKTEHRHWIGRRIKEYGFVEGLDFRSNLTESSGGRQAINYIVTLDMAKELAMLENNEIGRGLRRYLIEIEKQYRDWIGVWLPKLETDCNLFDNRKGYNYGQLLLALGLSVSKSGFYSRISRNRQEFWKNYSKVWYVSEEYGKNIILYTLARKAGCAIKQRRIAQQANKLIHNL